jgi:hypothetical protein
LSEAFQLASGRWLRHRLVNQVKTRLRLLLHVLTALHKVSRRFWQRVYPMPRVSPLNSQVAFRSQISGIVFNIADSTEGFHGLCLGHVSSPVRLLSLSRLSASFFFGGIPFRDRPSHSTVLIRSSNHYPLVTANTQDRNFPELLTRLGTVSNRPYRSIPFSRLLATREHRQRDW